MLRCSTNVWIAVVNDTIATPASTSVLVDRSPPNDAPTTYVTATVSIANTNDTNGTGAIGQPLPTSPQTAIISVAPNPAPAAAPSRYGSTSGLRNTPW